MMLRRHQRFLNEHVSCICVYTIQLAIPIFLVLSALALQLVRQTYSIDFFT